MKTLRGCSPASSLSQSCPRLWILLRVTVLFLATCAGAAVTPLPLTESGVDPIHFDTLPTPADGWSTIAWAGDKTNIATIAAMDIAANTNSAVNIIGALTTDPTGSTPTAPFGISAPGFAFRWNSVDHNIESRPTGIAYQALLLTVRNESVGDKNRFYVEYELGALFPEQAAEAEDDDNQLAGLRVYYSLTGLPGSWTHIPDLDGGLARAGYLAAGVFLPSPWEVGANLYIMWTDDNAVNGSGGNGPGPIEGPYTIDNLHLSYGECFPTYITTQPHSVSVESCHATNLSVMAFGGALHYQWFHAGTNLPGTDSPILNIPVARPENAGSYFVRITNWCSGTVAVSPHVQLTVTPGVPDADPPIVLSTLALSDGLTCQVAFNKGMEPGTLLPGAFAIRPTGGGQALTVTNVIMASNYRDLTLQCDAARTPNINYQLLIQPGVSDCSGTPISNHSVAVPLQFEVVLMAIENTPWKYNHSGLDLGLNWIAPDYDDSAWSNGISLFDAKSFPRQTVSRQAVVTHLPLHFGTYVTDDVPVYYFRGAFTLPASAADVTALNIRTFVDDHAAIWMNGYPDPVHVDMGNGDQDYLRYGYSGGTLIRDANFLPTTGSYSLDLSKLVDGQNLVAAKVFQQANTSSDITFALELSAIVNAFVEVPKLTISLDPVSGAILLGWPAGSGSQLYEATQPDATGTDGPGGWNPVSGATDGSFTITPAEAGAIQKFYTLRK